MKKKIYLILFFCSFFVFNQANAQFVGGQVSQENVKQNVAFAGKAGYSPASEPEEVVAQIIQYLLSFLGVIFVILTIYAGFLWMTAQGDSDQVSTAKGIMVNAVIGIAIVLTSYVITNAILTNLGKAVG